MKLTTKGRFAVTAMLDIAMHAAEAGRPISIAQVSERQQISLPYLEQIFCRLRRAGLVESVRGPGGGYRLADRPEAITIDRIIKAVDENMDTRRGRYVSRRRGLSHTSSLARSQRCHRTVFSRHFARVSRRSARSASRPANRARRHRHQPHENSVGRLARGPRCPT